MRKNVRKVLEAFLKGKKLVGDHKHTISTDGNTIYSYDMPIARRYYDGSTIGYAQIINVEQGPTRTTRSQIRSLIVYYEHHTSDPHEIVDQLYATEPHKFRKVER